MKRATLLILAVNLCLPMKVMAATSGYSISIKVSAVDTAKKSTDDIESLIKMNAGQIQSHWIQKVNDGKSYCLIFNDEFNNEMDLFESDVEDINQEFINSEITVERTNCDAEAMKNQASYKLIK